MMAIAMGAIEFMAQRFDLLPDYIQVYKIPYIFLIGGIILISGILVYNLANRLMKGLEKLKKPTFLDHARQSIFYYLLLLAIFINWIFVGYSGGENDVYFVCFLMISIVAIGMNYHCLFKFRKSQQH